jgi:glucose-1-phosphate cytidylyltransferase
MKTIILCGGIGTRLREETEFKPKPMVMIGERPMLLHIMEIYAKYNHKDFLLCLGYKGEMIREYFLHLAHFGNDIELDLASNAITYLQKRIQLDYRISFIETGLDTQSGGRVLQAARFIDDARFMVTYGDGVSTINIEKVLAFHDRAIKRLKTVATITAVHPSSKYGQVIADRTSRARRFEEKPKLHDYINGGFMVFEKAALRYVRPSESLEEGLERMTKNRKLALYHYEGFWHGMDTFKDVQYLNTLWKEQQPWAK